ncbi:RiPP maturation radical SAM C-methyltransferase [Flavitalea sp. BT771]|uniref:RiPP maturation radical SAM C-methyltransferase n=1 Tax=Flavitalea sp. BT771 TaxID=3063329 RepID=UPI0026E441C3|nr:RiPP maturation radical SAM C-methyltransferase [Flavitalea sp. BT771]MDO6433014.1 RiPP maturation radical SAM C-methyltransferase [Flavitalea sp. BT771]MDV6221710.1 RiPP maturation radical SAM C-methyltransferase [Flavitalea sp. BT771]
MRLPHIRFVATPFLPEYQPALGISNLLSIVKRNGYQGDIKYLNLDFGKKFGWDLYNFIAVETPPELLIGEFLFTKALGICDDHAFEIYFQTLFEQWGSTSSPRIPFSELKIGMKFLFDVCPRVVEKWADELLADDIQVVGFTSTFQQNVASLAVAKVIKQRKGDRVKIVFGGANLEDIMGKTLFKAFDFIDYVISGEAESSILPLLFRCTQSLGGMDRAYINGEMVTDMDSIPLPDFDDFFSSLPNSKVERDVYLSFESSRGCWWGMKSHCTFCGLNGNTMQYRSKSPGLFVQQIENLSTLYGNNSFMITDNILDLSYIKNVFPAIAASKHRYSLFYETKSNLRKDQLQIMAAGGVNCLQPGIESLSTSILKLMGKGTTKLQNIQILKWGRELNINMIWNLLFGFPNEDVEEYSKMVQLIPALVHLTPPVGYGKIRIDRFGPYWKEPAKYGIHHLRPVWSYEHVYRNLQTDLHDIAYYFEFDYADEQHNLSYVTRLVQELNIWKESGSDAVLELVQENGTVYISDTRPCALHPTYCLNELEYAILLCLDAAMTGVAITQHIKIEHPSLAACEMENEISFVLTRFLRYNYIVAEGNKYFSLVLNPSTIFFTH